MNTLTIVALPFLGTAIGASTVLLARHSVSSRIHNALLGFAAGVMVAASVWSLIIPSLELSEPMGRMSWMPAAVGIILGMRFLLALDSLVPHMHPGTDTREGLRSTLGKRQMLMLAVTLHNIPEGAIISLPLRGDGMSRGKAFGYGALSGIVEPISALAMVLLYEHISPILPYLLSFSAGAMLYVVVEELIPETQQGKHSDIGTIAFAIGFVIMMILDVALA